MSDAVMLLIVTPSGELLMHLRDEKVGILHPGCWAGFGGRVEPGESLEQALQREVLEETGIFTLANFTFLGDVVDEIAEGGRGDRVHMYFSHGEIRIDDIELTEGAGVRTFSYGELLNMRVSPFVMRAPTAHLDLLTGATRMPEGTG
jgi:8-oxo-dGTP pyrophosphatase MutT (NUDIX family)